MIEMKSIRKPIKKLILDGNLFIIALNTRVIVYIERATDGK